MITTKLLPWQVAALIAVVFCAGALFAFALSGGWSNGADRPSAASVADGALPATPLPPLPDTGRPGAMLDGEELLPVSTDDARSINGARPVNSTVIPPAPPLGSRLTGADYERAVTCLAVAALYEAGGGADDQRSVMQVIVNRVRHPAFPNSVCGVIFQGQERRTGCQFSFTCDGSLLRWRPSGASYQRARTLAAVMVKTGIDPRVGLATHYHTDWVVPYWSASLDKIAVIKTHLFFRWNGYWGTRAAFSAKPASKEPIVPRIASFDASHVANSAVIPEDGVLVLDAQPGIDTKIDAPPVTGLPEASGPVDPILKLERLPLQAGAPPGRWSLNAVEQCGKRSQCRVVGWSGGAPVSGMTQSQFVANPPDFIYVQDLPNRTQQAYWNCDRFARQGTALCLGSATKALKLATGS